MNIKSSLIILIAFLQSNIASSANLLTNEKSPHLKNEQTNQVISFTENKGQFSDQYHHPRPDILFGGSSDQLTFHISKSGISYQLNKINSYTEVEDLKTKEKRNQIDQQTIYRTDIKWLNANQDPIIKTDEVIPGTSSYYLAQCPNGVLNVKSYKGITLQHIYKNIDLHYYQKEGQLKYDYIVAAHANYKQIQLEVSGATIKLQKDGSLLIETPLGKIQEQAPLVYQHGKALKAHYTIQNTVIGFEIENYDPTSELIIDPVTRLWGTYYGGSGDDLCTYTSADASGNVYASGHTGSSTGTLIATTGSHQNTFGGSGFDAFLVKFNSNGLRLWSTYYGGTGSDFSYSTNLDGSGNIYMCGYTSSNVGTVMSTSGSHQAAYGGGTYDAYLVKFDSNGNRLWASYYGGTGTDVGNGCSVDASGNVYMSGYTAGATGTIIATNGSHQSTYGGGTWDAFLVKFNNAGVRQWGTYYGGSVNDVSYACATDPSGNIYMSGYSGSSGTSIATSGSHQSANNGADDGFLVKFNSAGIRQWATFYGGSANDPVYSCATDAAGNVFISGHTTSNTGTLISSAGSYQSTLGGGWDSFVAKFNSNGVRSWGTYCGGTGNDFCYSCVTDAWGNVLICGYTSSSSGTAIASAGSYQSTHGGVDDAYLVKYSSTGNRIWGTYYGGTGSDFSNASSNDASGNVYLSGATNSSSGNAIATSGSHQDTFLGVHDVFLVKFSDCSNIAPTISVNSTLCAGSTLSLTASISATNGLIYNWTGPNSYISTVRNPTIGGLSSANSGVYTLVATNSICIETATVLVGTVNPVPTISVNSGSICSGTSFTISPAGAVSYTVTGGNFIVSPNSTTSYSVAGKSTQGCSSSQVVSTVTVNTCTGIGETAASHLNAIKIYPNPSDGKLNLILDLEQDSELLLELFDCSGRKIRDVFYQKKYPSGETVISQELGTISAGIYFLRATVNGASNTLKWIVED